MLQSYWMGPQSQEKLSSPWHVLYFLTFACIVQSHAIAKPFFSFSRKQAWWRPWAPVFHRLEGIWIFFHPLPSDLVAVCRADTFDVAGFCKFLCVENHARTWCWNSSSIMSHESFQHPWCLDDPCTDPFSALPHFQEMSRFNRLLSQMTMTLKQLQKADIVRWKTATNSWLQLQDTWIFPQLGVGKKHNDVYSI